MAPTDFAHLMHPSSSSSPLSTSSRTDASTLSSSSSPDTPATSLHSRRSASPCESGYIVAISGQVQLPTHLPRPATCCSIDDAAIQLDEQLQSIPRQYIFDRLTRSGTQLLHAINDTEVATTSSHRTPSTSYFVRSSLPSTANSPDRVLAISCADSDGEITLQPIHGLVLAMNCSAFSSLGKSALLPEMDAHATHISKMIDEHDTQTRRIPSVSFTLPDKASVTTFKDVLLPYFYTGDSTSLLSALLSLSHPPCASTTELLQETPSILSSKLSILPIPTLMRNLQGIHKTWQVAVAVRAGGDKLWKTMQLAWAVNVAALVIKEDRERECE